MLIRSVLKNLVVLALLAGCLLSSPAAAEWPTIDWRAECHETVAGISGPGDCSPIEGASSVSGYLVEALVDGSHWLESLGYLAPALVMGSEPVGGQTVADGRYTVYLFSGAGACHLGRCADSAAGVYFPEWPGQLHDVGLYVSQSSIESASEGSRGTAVHELFHAVQHAYPAFDAVNVAGWIVEGTARAVGNQWLHQRGHQMRLGQRSYSDPLHEPANDGGIYATSMFWRSIAVHDGWDVFDTLFRNRLEGNGLDGIDKGLRSTGSKGLTEAFLRFVERIGERDAQAVHLDTCADLAVDPDQPDDRHSTQLAPVAAECHHIRATAHSEEGSCLRIEVESDEGRDDLHLLRKARRYPGLVDSVQLNAGESFDAHYQLVNAADKTAESQPRAATIKASLGAGGDDCEAAWALSAGGQPIGSVRRQGEYATFSVSNHRMPPGTGYTDALTHPDSPDPGPPWLHVELESHHLLEDADSLARLARTGSIDEPMTSIRITAPSCPTGCIGQISEPYVSVNIDGQGFQSNADSAAGPIGDRYVRGRLRTAEVHIDRHDDDWVEGSFEARLAPIRRSIPEGMAATQRGESIWQYPELEVEVSGRFRARSEPDTEQRAEAVMEMIGVDPSMLAAAETMAERMREQQNEDEEGPRESSPGPSGEQRPAGEAASSSQSSSSQLIVDHQTTDLQVSQCMPGDPETSTSMALQVIASGRTRDGRAFQIQTGQVVVGPKRQVINLVLDDQLYNATYSDSAEGWRESRGHIQTQPPLTLTDSVIEVAVGLGAMNGGQTLDFRMKIDCSRYE